MSDATLAQKPDAISPKRGFAWSGLARIEAKHLVASVFLIVGVLAAFVLTLRDFGVRGLGLDPTWPTIPADTTDVWHMAEALAPLALLAGAWLALRDRRSGARDLVHATPTSQPALTLTRLASLIAISALSFMVLFAVGLVASVIRGGHGTPDLRLLLDGSLGVAFAAVLGFAIGTATRSMVTSLFAAPLYGFAIFFLDYYNVRDDFHLSWQWLSPTPQPPIERSVVLGWLPDIVWAHIAFIAGALITMAALIALVPSIRRPSGRAIRVALGLLGVLAIAAGSVAGSILVRKPDLYVPTGPRVADWRPVYNGGNGLIVGQPFTTEAFAYPDDHRATTCASVSGFTACVYPAYGSKLAKELATVLGREAALVGNLAGVPQGLRMVPLGSNMCIQSDGAVLFWENAASGLVNPYSRPFLSGLLVSCAFSAPRSPGRYIDTQLPDSQQAVELWVQMRLGAIDPREAQQALGQPMGSTCSGPLTAGTTPGQPGSNCVPVVSTTTGEWLPDAIRAALSLNAMPVNQAHALIARFWSEIRAGSLPVSQLTSRN